MIHLHTHVYQGKIREKFAKFFWARADIFQVFAMAKFHRTIAASISSPLPTNKLEKCGRDIMIQICSFLDVQEHIGSFARINRWTRSLAHSPHSWPKSIEFYPEHSGLNWSQWVCCICFSFFPDVR